MIELTQFTDTSLLLDDSNSSKGWYKMVEATVGDLQKLYLLGTKWPQNIVFELN